MHPVRIEAVRLARPEHIVQRVGRAGATQVAGARRLPPGGAVVERGPAPVGRHPRHVQHREHHRSGQVRIGVQLEALRVLLVPGHHVVVHRERQVQQSPAPPTVVAPREIDRPRGHGDAEAEVDRVARGRIREHLAVKLIGTEIATTTQGMGGSVGGDDVPACTPVVRACHIVAGSHERIKKGGIGALRIRLADREAGDRRVVARQMIGLQDVGPMRPPVRGVRQIWPAAVG